MHKTSHLGPSVTVGVDRQRIPKSSTDSCRCDVIGRQAGGDAPQVVVLVSSGDN